MPSMEMRGIARMHGYIRGAVRIATGRSAGMDKMLRVRRLGVGHGGRRVAMRMMQRQRFTVVRSKQRRLAHGVALGRPFPKARRDTVNLTECIENRGVFTHPHVTRLEPHHDVS